jgi:uncharacterized protein (TIGR02001 family)
MACTLGGLVAASLALAPIPAVSALAADDRVAEEEAATDSMFDIAFGAAVTSDYISRGITQTNHNPAVQGYVELDYGIAYVSIWASNVDFAGAKDTEIDLAVGVRPEWDRFSFDLGYVHYVYANNISPAYGELYALIDFSATDDLTLGTDVYFAPDYSQAGGTALYGEANAEYALPWNFAVSAAVGYQAFAASLGLPDYVTWNAGVSWTWNDTRTVDVRYSDTNLSTANCATLMAANACNARVMATLSVDTSWSALSGN